MLLPRLPGGRCNSSSPFQPAWTNVLQRALVPGSALNPTGTPRRSLLSLPYIGAPLGAGGYHSNDTAPSPPPRASAPTKDAAPLAQQPVDGLLLQIERALPSLPWNRPVQLPAIAARHAACPSRRLPVTEHHPRAHAGGGRERIAQTHHEQTGRVDGLPPSPSPSRPLSRSCREPLPRRRPLSAGLCAAATHARPGPRSRGL